MMPIRMPGLMVQFYDPLSYRVALEPGARLGPHEILALIASGGMGEVCRAHDTQLSRDVSIKALRATNREVVDLVGPTNRQRVRAVAQPVRDVHAQRA